MIPCFHFVLGASLLINLFLIRIEILHREKQISTPFLESLSTSTPPKDEPPLVRTLRPPRTSTADIATTKTKTETYYGATYQRWQLAGNKFSVKAKMHYFRPYIQAHFHCAEFGSASGHLISELGCATQTGIEVNPHGRQYAKEHLRIAEHLPTSKVCPRPHARDQENPVCDS